MTPPGHKVGQILKLLERQSKVQKVGNANGYPYGIFNSRYNFKLKVCRELKMAAILKNLKYLP